MAREVEHQLETILGNAKGGGKEEGAKELKLLKDRNRLLMDVSPLAIFVTCDFPHRSLHSQVWS